MDVNLREYELQLQSVEDSIKTNKDPKDLIALKSLKSDILELIELTKQMQRASQSNHSNEYSINEELEHFKNDVASFNNEDSKESKRKISEVEDIEEELKELKVKLESMVGQKCSAPHQHTWGARSYHNAIICGIEDTANVDCNGILKARLRVLFTNPTHREMLPCSFYLEGDCRFDDAQCYFSHGELINVEELGTYTEPDFSSLARNCVVLAKLPDRLWHRGRVLCANFVEKQCRVRLDRINENKRDRDFAFEDLLPIFHDDDLSSGNTSEASDDGDLQHIDGMEIARQKDLSEKSLFDFKPTQPLGEWEKHTRGIGSKIMAKMGYIHGTGLGSDGNGIVVPVTTHILPQGCSLDRCMELREASNGDKNFFSVEKKLRLQQKKQENVNAKAYARETQRTDVFSFLNENVLNRCSQWKEIKKNNSLRNETTRSLNVASVRIADDIRRKEKEIAHLQQSIGRNVIGADVHKRLQQQLQIKKEELRAMQREESSLSREQASRKTKDKICLF